jgi:hypothetical protein
MDFRKKSEGRERLNKIERERERERGSISGKQHISLSLPLPLAIMFDDGSQTKITNLEIHVSAQKDVAQLKIAMDNAVVVHILDGAKKLPHIKSDFGFREPFSLFDHVDEGLYFRGEEVKEEGRRGY